MQIDTDRLWESLHQHAKFGGTPDGGVSREALTPADKEGRDQFVRWCREAKLEVAWDELGTIFATRPGRDNSLKPLAFGSHLDTQPTGGKFDGIYGVLGGLEVMRSLNDKNIVTERPLTLISWTNEEGSRFTPSMMASGVYSGCFKLEDVYRETDVKGKVFKDELKKIGYLGQEKVGARSFQGLLELHIEQGPILEAKNMQVGVVTGAQGMNFSFVTVQGRSSHSGTTPMEYRLDATCAAARLILEVEKIAVHEEPGTFGTVGKIFTDPSSYCTIPHTVRFSVDFRNPDEAALVRVLRWFDMAIEAERKRGYSVKREVFGNAAVQHFDRHLVANVRLSAEEAQVRHCDIISGAGHDSVYMNRVLPVAMIFIPCKGGLSHNPAESITKEDAVAGVEVLLRTVVRVGNER